MPKAAQRSLDVGPGAIVFPLLHIRGSHVPAISDLLALHRVRLTPLVIIYL